MKINLPFPIDQTDNEKQVSNQQITWNYIGQAFTKRFPDGLSGQLQRQFGRIQRKFDAAVLDEAETIDLTIDEVELISKTFNDEEKVKFPAVSSVVVVMIGDAIDEALKEAKKSTDGTPTS